MQCYRLNREWEIAKEEIQINLLLTIRLFLTMIKFEKRRRREYPLLKSHSEQGNSGNPVPVGFGEDHSRVAKLKVHGKFQ